MLIIIVDGDWQEVEKLCAKPLVKNHKSFLYSLYKQQYLEYIERREIQKVMETRRNNMRSRMLIYSIW